MKDPPANTAVFSTSETVAYLRTSRASLYRWFKSGDLKFIKMGGRTLVRRADADDFVARCAAGHRPARPPPRS